MRSRSLTSLAVLLAVLAAVSLTLVLAQPAPQPAAPAAAPQIVPSANPQAWGPVLSDLTPTSVRVSYKTVTPAQITIRCDDRDFPATASGVFHKALLTDLKPGAEHIYQVLTDAGGRRSESDKYQFATPAENLQSFDFVVYGDTRTNTGDHQSVVSAILPNKPALVINTGDLVENGLKEDAWNTFFPVIAPLVSTVPYYPCLGNHERESSVYYDFFNLPAGEGRGGEEWYSFTYGDAFFAVLDGNTKLAEQAQWLDGKLQEAAGKYRWTFVISHEPPYSSGSHGSDPKAVQYLVPVFEKHKVTMVFCGHDHIYERSEKAGVVYIVAGGGGAPLYPVDQRKNPYSKVAVSSLHYCLISLAGDSLKLRTSKPDGTAIDEFTLTSRTQ